MKCKTSIKQAVSQLRSAGVSEEEIAIVKKKLKEMKIEHAKKGRPFPKLKPMGSLIEKYKADPTMQEISLDRMGITPEIGVIGMLNRMLGLPGYSNRNLAPNEGQGPAVLNTLLDKSNPTYLKVAAEIIKKAQIAIASYKADDHLVGLKIFKTENERTEAIWTPEGIKVGIDEDSNLNGGTVILLIGNDYADKMKANENLDGIIGPKVYHEILHSLTEVALNTNHDLLYDMKIIQNAALKQLTYKSFLKDGGIGASHSDIEHAKALMLYIGAKPAEFMAHSLSDPILFDAVSKVKLSPEYIKKYHETRDEDGKVIKLTAWENVANKFIEVINKVYGAFKVNPNAMKALQSLTERIIEQDIEIKVTGTTVKDYHYNNIEYKDIGGKLDRANEYLVRMNEAIAERIEGMSFITPDKVKGSAARFFDKSIEVLSLGRLKDAEVFQSLWHTIWNETAKGKFAEFYQMFRQISADNNKHQIELRDATKKYFEEIFKDVDYDVRRSLSDVLNVDWRAGFKDVSEFVNMLEDEAALEAEIKKMRSEVGFNEYIAQARDLGWYMMHNEAKSKHLMKNAHMIFYRRYSLNEDISALRNSGEPDANAIARIDKLATLYAMKYMDENNKANIIKHSKDKRKFGKNGLSAIDTLSSISEYYYAKKDNQAKGFGDLAKYLDKNMVKKDSLGEYKFDIVPERALEEMRKFGFKDTYKEMKHVAELKGSNEKHYLMVGKDYSSSRTQGMIDDVSLIEKSTTMNGLYDGKDIDYAKKTKLVSERKMLVSVSAIDPDTDYSMEEMRARNDNMIAILNVRGFVDDYGVELSNSDKREYMLQNDDIVNTIAKTGSHADAKITAVKNNMVGVDGLIKMSLEHMDDKDFVTLEEIDDKSPFKTKEAKLRSEQWAMIPDYTRLYIQSKNRQMILDGILPEGTNIKSIRVHKSLLNDIVGYKDVSLARANLFGYDLAKHPTISTWIEKAEYYWKKIASRFKKLVVFFMPAVVLANITSNAFVAMMHGIGPIEYVKGFVRGWTDLTRYQETLEELNLLKVQLDSGDKSVSQRIEALEKELELNPSNRIVQDGQYNMIIEDIEVKVMEKSDHLENKINEMLDKVGAGKDSKFREYVDVGYMAKAGRIKKQIEKITLLNDIVNRRTIQEKMFEDIDRGIKSGKLERASRARLEQDALNYVDQLFINYSYADNKFVKYANDMLIVNFTKYYFRAVKAMKAMYERNPLGAFSMFGFDNLVIDVSEPFSQYLNPIDTLMNKFMFVGRNDPFGILSTLIVPRAAYPVGLGE